MATNSHTLDRDCDFDSSELGTKDYWDSAYRRENETYEDIGDVGEIWFGEDKMERIVSWLEDCDTIQATDSIMDLGCGNGMTCIELRRRGFTDIVGVDYSELAVMLATSVARSEGFEDIQFVVGDLITAERPNPCTCLSRQYKVVLDKGTYDAISLMPGDSLSARLAYHATVKGIMGPDSLFSITSCNWTKDQLMEFFGTDFQLHAQIPFKTFQFGGQTGSTVTSLVLKLKCEAS